MTETADAGTSTVGADPFTHPALLYKGADEYLAGTVPFVTGGLAADEPVAVAAPTPKLTLLRRELGRAAEDVRLLDITEAGAHPGRVVPGLLRAFADTHPGRQVRIVGEAILPDRAAGDYPDCVQHEALINLAFAGRPVTILCPYDAEHLDQQVLADAARTHPVLVDADGSRRSPDYVPERAVTGHDLPLAAPLLADVLTVGATELSSLRRFAQDYAVRVGLDARRQVELVLVVTELATNGIEHGGGLATVALYADREQLVCQVSDTGRPVPPDPAGAGGSTIPRQFRGHGLLMVNHLADLVRVHSSPEGTVVRARFTL
jgi:anti-sigma regulatory factor (Ser/Thr protein kinase)